MMKRITIIGNSGAGKSTLAVLLGKELKLPVFHIDKLLWKPGWVRTPEEEFIIKHREILQKEEWIFEGVAYKSTYDDRFTQAEVIIYLDTPIEKCIDHAKKRMEEELVRPNPYVSENCPYEGDIQDNIKVIELFHNEYRKMILKKLENYKEKTIILDGFQASKKEDLINLIDRMKILYRL